MMEGEGVRSVRSVRRKDDAADGREGIYEGEGEIVSVIGGRRDRTAVDDRGWGPKPKQRADA